jgi:REP element-mobilizing transposase RayT
MARPLRLAFEEAVYHITARGNRKENIFYEDIDRAVFLDKINETCDRYSLVCYAYCLMDNHYHLFLKTPNANISEGMHYLNASYTNWFKSRHKIVGVVFQGRYKSIIVDANNYSRTLSAYIHLNPRRAGMVGNPRDYKWSSYREYLGDRRPLEMIDTEFILRQFDSDLNKARTKYESFVLNNLALDNPLKDSYKGIVVGSENFINSVKEKMKSLGEEREIVQTRNVSAYSHEEIIQQVMEDLSVSRDDIFRRRRGNWYRQLTLFLLKRHTSMSLREIGDMFHMDYAAVSQACKRYEKKIENRGIPLK